jgi:hypothetical protein
LRRGDAVGPRNGGVSLWVMVPSAGGKPVSDPDSSEMYRKY